MVFVVFGFFRLFSLLIFFGFVSSIWSLVNCCRPGGFAGAEVLVLVRDSFISWKNLFATLTRLL